MKIEHLVLTLVLFIAASSCEKPNQAPVIDGLYASPDSVFPGDTVLLRGSATELDGETILFEWSFEQSILENPLWIAPLKPGDYFITLKASDGILTVQDSLMVHVKDTTGSFIDPRDNHEYKWVKIGKQIWMTENLAYLPKLYFTTDTSTSDPRYYILNFGDTLLAQAKMQDYYNTYGVLYNWPSAVLLCPLGWHLPSDDEWKMLERYLGMSIEDSNEGEWDRISGDVGRKLKSTYGWNNNGNGDNSSGFNALPAGHTQHLPNRNYIGIETIFWTSTTSGYLSNAWQREIDYLWDKVNRLGSYKSHGFSVRCVKDE